MEPEPNEDDYKEQLDYEEQLEREQAEPPSEGYPTH